MDFDDRLNRPIDPVAIATKQQQFNDDLKQERLAQAFREQVAIRKCTNEKCPADQCHCNFSEQFHPQYTPQVGDLGYNPSSPYSNSNTIYCVIQGKGGKLSIGRVKPFYLGLPSHVTSPTGEIVMAYISKSCDWGKWRGIR